MSSKVPLPQKAADLVGYEWVLGGVKAGTTIPNELLLKMIAEIEILQNNLEAEELCRKEITDAYTVLEDQLAEEREYAQLSLGWFPFIDACRDWLKHYPASIFTGESGDPGALFIVKLREAVEMLDE